MKNKIIITTKQSNGIGFSVFDDCFLGSAPSEEELLAQLNHRQRETDITIFTEGEVSTGESGETQIKYHEDAEDGDGTDVVISFNKSEPKEIVISRSGESSSIMLFSEGKRTITVYRTPFMPFELGIYTGKITNKFDSEGYFEIAYIVEIKGALAQYTNIRLEVKR